ncbi:MAG TPA: hypothetical protein VFA95_09935 [Gammaproteobacteria bacterium]|nr:hypothetical protein [Gammaproteobacteria bacterium]
MRPPIPISLAVMLAGAGSAYGQPSYTFSPSEYQRSAFEIGGYAEGRLQAFQLDPNSAFYELNKPSGDRPGSNGRATGTLELTGQYHKSISTLNFTVHGDGTHDALFGNSHQTKLYEGGLNVQPAVGLSFYLGKRTLLWGKGYAWNPVGFVQRPKDPTDPNLAREGFWMATIDYTRSIHQGPIRTIGLTSVLIPSTPALNNDFGPRPGTSVAGKLYFLVGNTDIDLMALSGGAKSARYGADFSTAVTPALEVHGELAHITMTTRLVLNQNGQPSPIRSSATSYLLGLNYLTQSNTTFLLEYYHNGEGFQASEADAFYTLAHDAFAQFRSSGTTSLLQRADSMSSMYMRPNPMRDYLNFRVSQKEPFDILYFTPSLMVQANLTDHSALVLPELVYTGFHNVELRLRGLVNVGPSLTEFGEKQAASRIEFRVRYYF